MNKIRGHAFSLPFCVFDILIKNKLVKAFQKKTSPGWAEIWAVYQVNVIAVINFQAKPLKNLVRFNTCRIPTLSTCCLSRKSERRLFWCGIRVVNKLLRFFSYKTQERKVKALVESNIKAIRCASLENSSPHGSLWALFAITSKSFASTVNNLFYPFHAFCSDCF